MWDNIPWPDDVAMAVSACIIGNVKQREFATLHGFDRS
jgi:hypothetical protein